MELKLISTNRSDCILVDNIPLEDILNKKDIVKRIKIGPELLNDFLQFLLEKLGTYEVSDKPCSQCGDYIETYTLDVYE